MHRHLLPIKLSIVFLLMLCVVTQQASFAQETDVQGFIKSRDGDKLILQTADSPNVVVLLTDSTEVGQVQGLLKARRKEMSMAALIPGLEVKVKGTPDQQHQIVAEKVSFKGNDLERAQSIQAGMHETTTQAEENKKGISQNQQQISENKSAIDAAAARFGQLDDYHILDEVTVYFANGKSDVDPKFVSQLMELAQKSKSINGYMVEVTGYASSSGSVELNQKLSEDRAASVTNILVQQAKIPLTRVLAPGAMGESEQVSSDKAMNDEEANRRVRVRLLQNKAVAGS